MFEMYLGRLSCANSSIQISNSFKLLSNFSMKCVLQAGSAKIPAPLSTDRLYAHQSWCYCCWCHVSVACADAFQQLGAQLQLLYVLLFRLCCRYVGNWSYWFTLWSCMGAGRCKFQFFWCMSVASYSFLVWYIDVDLQLYLFLLKRSCRHQFRSDIETDALDTKVCCWASAAKTCASDSCCCSCIFKPNTWMSLKCLKCTLRHACT